VGFAGLQANQILGLAPGEVFVQRNVGNLATHKDMNAMACLEFAVDVLKVPSGAFLMPSFDHAMTAACCLTCCMFHSFCHSIIRSV
jgi:Carbonic anhydrase